MNDSVAWSPDEEVPSQSDMAVDLARDPEDAKLFLRLFLENQRRLYAYVLTLVPHRADADDILQEVSFVLWDRFNPRNPPENFVAWGCRIAYFKVLEMYKRNRRGRIAFRQEILERLAETASEHAETLQLDDRRYALRRCQEKLSDRDRNLLRLRYAEGSTTESTAASVGRSVDAVYKALARIRQALFECVNRSLAQEGY